MAALSAAQSLWEATAAGLETVAELELRCLYKYLYVFARAMASAWPAARHQAPNHCFTKQAAVHNNGIPVRWYLC